MAFLNEVLHNEYKPLKIQMWKPFSKRFCEWLYIGYNCDIFVSIFNCNFELISKGKQRDVSCLHSAHSIDFFIYILPWAYLS